MHRSRCALCLSFLFAVLVPGCAEPPVPVTKLKYHLIPGIFADQLSFTNEEAEPLSSVDLKIIVRTETGAVEVSRHWGMWASKEVKVVELPVGIGSVEEVTLRGAAMFHTSAKAAKFDKGWIMVRTPEPGK